MDKKLTVACVLWMGDFRTRNYTFEWVRKLRNMVARNLTIPHEFVCLTNVWEKIKSIEGIKLIQLKNDWPGWWSKLELFRPGLFEGRVLYLDLDMVILKNIDSLANQEAPFVLLKNEGKGERETNDGLSIYRYNSSVMNFEAGSETVNWIYNSFCKKRIETFRGDQDYYAWLSREYPTFPKPTAIKLKDCQNGWLHGSLSKTKPENAKIVLCMPNKNDIAADLYPWVKEVWQ